MFGGSGSVVSPTPSPRLIKVPSAGSTMLSTSYCRECSASRANSPSLSCQPSLSTCRQGGPGFAPATVQIAASLRGHPKHPSSCQAAPRPEKGLSLGSIFKWPTLEFMIQPWSKGYASSHSPTLKFMIQPWSKGYASSNSRVGKDCYWPTLEFMIQP
ncbi:uncharacterized protein LOC144174366 [Haemaphysalis longicornis]